MRIFLTGATGFIGSQLVHELTQAGHQVLGLTRSAAGAQQLRTAGAEPYHGDIDDLPGLQRAAADSDAVIHTAFDHNFATFVDNCEKDRRVILAFGEALRGSNRPLLITSGTAMGCAAPGQPASEDHFDPNHPNPRVASELAGEELLQRGINLGVLRLSQIHNPLKQGLVTYAIAHAKQKGISAYIGEGQNQWSAAPLTDTAHLYRLALEKHQPGARYHATAEEGIAFRAIAESIGQGLGLPVVGLSEAEAAEHFGWLTAFVGKDMSASAAKTRERLGWQPLGKGLLADVVAGLKWEEGE